MSVTYCPRCGSPGNVRDGVFCCGICGLEVPHRDDRSAA